MGKGKAKKSGSSSGSSKKVIEIQEPTFGISPTKSKENTELSYGDKKLLKKQEAEEKQKELEKQRLEEASKAKTELKKKSSKPEENVNTKKEDDDDYHSYTNFNQTVLKKPVPTCSNKENPTNIDYWDSTELPETDENASGNCEKESFESPSRSGQERSPFSNWKSSDENRYKNDKYQRSKNKSGQNPEIDYDIFESKLNKTKMNFGKVKEVKGDLFDAPEDFSLAHCVAEDFSMGAGIAVQFRKKFRKIPELLSQNAKTGEVATIKVNDIFVYYLVTKKYSYSKPTLLTVWNSLIAMKEHMTENKVTKVAMPEIGCGLDRLDWGDVKQMLEYIFQDIEVEIRVYSLDLSQTSLLQTTSKDIKKAYKKNAPHPLVNIEPGTGLIFFGTEDGYISEELRSLDEKYSGLIDFYKRERKISGEIIRFTRHKDYIYGLIWKKSRNSEINFKAFSNCLYNLKKANKEDQYNYFGFDAFRDEYDGLLTLEKTINMFQSILQDIEIHICWPEKIRAYMPNMDRFNEKQQKF